MHRRSNREGWPGWSPVLTEPPRCRGWRLNDLPLRASFSPAHPLARRDVPLALARAFQFDKPRFRKWPRLAFTARIERAHSDRARSASKKGTWPLPPHPSEAARCASTEDHQAPSLTSFPSSPAHQNNAQTLSSRRRPGPSRSIRLAHGTHAQADSIP